MQITLAHVQSVCYNHSNNAFGGNQMKIRRIAAVFLALVAVVCLASCNQNTEESTVVSNTTSSGSGDKTYQAQIPDGFTLNGEEFVILNEASNPDSLKYTEFGYGELESSVINDAVLERNLYVEELLDCKIVERLVNRLTFECTNVVRNEVGSNLATFKIVAPAMLEASVLAQEGYFYNLYTLENLNGLNDEWWDAYFKESAEIFGKLFFATGDIGFFTRDTLPGIFFNKETLKSLELQSPYELVKEHKWTLDVMKTWAKGITEDVDNNGIIDYNDKFGVGGQMDNIWEYYHGSGEKLCTTDEKGYPIASFTTERAVNVVTKALEIMQDDNIYVCANDYFNDGGWYVNSPMEYITNAFVEGRSLFLSSSLSALEDLRNMDIDFGILPIPMYDETQDNYYSLINPWRGNAFTIPNYLTEDEAEAAAVVMNVLGAEGRNTLRPAYYEVALKGQRARDDESQEMLDIIFNTAGCDIGFIYNWGNMTSTILHAAVDAAPGSYISNADAQMSAIKAAIDATVVEFEKMK